MPQNGHRLDFFWSNHKQRNHAIATSICGGSKHAVARAWFAAGKATPVRRLLAVNARVNGSGHSAQGTMSIMWIPSVAQQILMANPFAASRAISSWKTQGRRMKPYAVAASLRKWRLPPQEEERRQSSGNPSDAFDTHRIDTPVIVKKVQATLLLLGLACRKSVCVGVETSLHLNIAVTAILPSNRAKLMAISNKMHPNHPQPVVLVVLKLFLWFSP